MPETVGDGGCRCVELPRSPRGIAGSREHGTGRRPRHPPVNDGSRQGGRGSNTVLIPSRRSNRPKASCHSRSGTTWLTSGRGSTSRAARSFSTRSHPAGEPPNAARTPSSRRTVCPTRGATRQPGRADAHDVATKSPDAFSSSAGTTRCSRVDRWLGRPSPHRSSSSTVGSPTRTPAIATSLPVAGPTASSDPPAATPKAGRSGGASRAAARPSRDRLTGHVSCGSARIAGGRRA